jgi:hypothetical protein
MYTRVTTSGGRSYLQLVEGHRDEQGKVRIKVVANLGRLDKLTPGKLDPLINGLNRAVGRLENTANEITHEPARAYGDVFALHELWKDLGFDRALGRALRSGKRKLDVEALVRAMVFNRLCAPDSKLGCLRWLDTVAMPALPETATHQHLLRAMDALMDHADRIEMELAKQLRPLVDRDLAVVFYDLTTVRIHGEGEVEDDLRAYGMNKERGGIARQFVMGVVQTAEGLPLMHTVHPGNVAETKTLQAMLATVLQRFPIERVILVADRGLLSLENIREVTTRLWPPARGEVGSLATSLLTSLTTSYATGAVMRDGVLLGVERRRRWTDEAKLAILGEVGVNGWTVADVARRHDVTRQHIGDGMIGPGTGVRVYLACGATDMRKGIAGLAALAQDSCGRSRERRGVRVPGPQGRPAEAALLGRPGLLPLLQGPRARPVSVAEVARTGRRG